MKATLSTASLLIALLVAVIPSFGSTTIDATNSHAYGASIGWINWRGDVANGAVIGQYVCSGYLYSANVGWISLGSGSPINGIQYQNTSSNDFGVNQDGLGDLRGYAYGVNIGWLNFENIGAPKVDLRTGNMSGFVWSANAGWISLSNLVAYVQSDSISPGTLDTNGLATAWELTYFGQTGINSNADPDHDGMSNYQEYLAGTNPTNSADRLSIISESFQPGGTNAFITWSTVPSRFYYVQKSTSLTPPSWSDSGLGLIAPTGLLTITNFADNSAPVRFYRVEAVQPLNP